MLGLHNTYNGEYDSAYELQGGLSHFKMENNHILRNTSGDPGPGGHYSFSNNLLASLLILIWTSPPSFCLHAICNGNG